MGEDVLGSAGWRRVMVVCCLPEDLSGADLAVWVSTGSLGRGCLFGRPGCAGWVEAVWVAGRLSVCHRVAVRVCRAVRASGRA